MAPARAAKAASLRYVNDASPGITRRRLGTGFSYRDANGRVVRDRHTLARMRSLAIPPAWRDVWICANPLGHLQATGRDARHRKQYRYHPRWRQTRDETKYAKLSAFARDLPKIRRRVRADLRLDGLPRNKVLAIIVRLLETTFVRIGNEEYARMNQSFGLTTLLDRHVHIEGAKVQLRFRGKSGKTHSVDIDDRRLAKWVKRCRDLPGQHLFQYVDDAGNPQPVDSGDVNAYLHEITGDDFTAKEFRTWGGTLLAAARVTEPHESAKKDTAALVAAVADVAEKLGNTVAICRKCYIHPAVLDAFVNGGAYARWSEARARPAGAKSLRTDERMLLRFLMLSEARAKAA